MSLVVTCPGCTKPTPAGKLLCIHCGIKLEGVTAAELQGRAKKKGPGAKARANSLMSALSRLVVIAILLGGVGMILWPIEPTGTVPVEAKEIERRAKNVQNALTALGDAATAGRPQDATFSEEDINAYLAQLLKANADVRDGSGATMGVTEVRTDIEDEAFTTVLVSTIGPVDLTWELKYRLESRAGRLRLKTDGGRLGHLPMPGPLSDFVQKKIGGFFQDLDEERKIWNNTDRFKVGSDKDGESVRIGVGK